MVMVALHSPAPGIGIGTWAWGNQFLWGYDPAQDREIAAAFRRAVDLGLRFVDTADSYGTGRFNGRSESLLGEFCAALPPAARREIVVATKLAPFPWRLGRQGYRRAFAASRQRLRGHLDRVQLHWSTARYAPWQERPLLDGLADLLLEGAVAELGVSNMGPRRLAAVHSQLQERGVRLTSLQVQLSLLAPQAIAAGGVAEVCRERGIELIAYSPLALGLLGRPPGDPRPLPGGARGLLFRRLWPRLQPLLAAMQEIGAPHGASNAAVALNWCRAHGAMPIPGLRRLDQVETVAAALGWRLSGPERERLDQLALPLAAAGVGMPANPFESA